MVETRPAKSCWASPAAVVGVEVVVEVVVVVAAVVVYYAAAAVVVGGAGGGAAAAAAGAWPPGRGPRVNSPVVES